jgi:hypothetical protein
MDTAQPLRRGSTGPARRSARRQRRQKGKAVPCVRCMALSSSDGVAVGTKSRRVGGGVVEGDLAPGLQRCLEGLAALRGVARMSGPSFQMSRPSLRASTMASSATRLAWRPAAIPIGWPIVPPPNCSTHVLAEVGRAAGASGRHGCRRRPPACTLFRRPSPARRRCRAAGRRGYASRGRCCSKPCTLIGSPSSLPTTVPAWMWSTPARRIHLAITRNEMPWLFWRV